MRAPYTQENINRQRSASAGRLFYYGGENLATTRLMPLHIGKGRTVGTAIAAIIDYVENPEKTDNGNLITSWQCDSRVADREFLLSKQQYIRNTGRVRGEDDVII